MGANLSKALSKMFGSKEMRILMLGLDAAGKTSKFVTWSRQFGAVVSENLTLYIACSYSLQAETEPISHYYPNRWFQCGISNIQKRQIQCVGCWRTRQNS